MPDAIKDIEDARRVCDALGLDFGATVLDGVEGISWDLAVKLLDRAERAESELELLVAEGKNFYAFIEGECPSLLEDDHNAYDFEILLEDAEKRLAKQRNAIQSPRDLERQQDGLDTR